MTLNEKENNVDSNIGQASQGHILSDINKLDNINKAPWPIKNTNLTK